VIDRPAPGPERPHAGSLARTAALGAFAAILCACHGARAPASDVSISKPQTSISGPATDGEWSYEVSAGSGANELAVMASFPPGSEPELSVDDGAEPFVRDVVVVQGRGLTSIPASGSSWIVPSCRTDGCRIRYRFLLADAAAKLRDPDVALAHRDVFVAPPSTWLLRPLLDRSERAVRFSVATPKDVIFASGIFPSPSEPNTFRATVADLPVAPYSAFGRLRVEPIDVGGRTVDVAFAPGGFAVGERAILDWIRASADVVAKYYGRFPVDRVLLLVLPGEGSGLGYGKTLGNGGASILIPIGRETKKRELDGDWMLVHEMLHLAFPSVPREHLWLEEGIATYIEPFARARAGRLSTEAAWRGLVKGLPNGLPEQGDRGLDNTHTWGRTYWGGALFCLLADIEIRERSGGHKSLDDALLAILRAGGNIAVRWELSRALAEGDRALGMPVLTDLHRKMGSRPYDVDVAALWTKLGVRLAGDKVTFDDRAPIAHLRRSITAERQ
jgi:hypothetical protein